MPTQEQEPNKNSGKSGMTEAEWKAMQVRLFEAMQEVLNDPELPAKIEEFHKKATTIPPEKLIRPFDI